MSIFKSKMINGLSYSNISFFFTIFIGFYSYRYLWENLSPSQFSGWIALFEFSQFLLLLDIGFTQGYIKKHAKTNVVDALQDLPNLRGTMFFMGAIASVFLLLIAVISNAYDSIGFFPVFLLSISVLLTLLCYADTAMLRLKEQFKGVYIINIVGNSAYLIILLFLPMSSAIYCIAIANLVRVLILFFLQNKLLNSGFSIRFKESVNPNGNVVILNASYFLLFMLDVIIMTAMKVPAPVIASVIILKKYYDTLRGLFDSNLSVLSVYFAKLEDSKRDILIFTFIFISFVLAFCFSGLIINVWLGENFGGYSLLSLSICFSSLALVFFRVDSSKSFFQGGTSMIKFGCLSVITKILFFVLLLSPNVSVSSVYALQGFVLLFFLFLFNRKNFLLTVFQKG